MIERYKKAVREAFRLKGEEKHRDANEKFDICDNFMLLTNQDDPAVVAEILLHIEIGGYAKKFKAIPSFVAKLNYATRCGNEYTEKLQPGDNLIIMFHHKEGNEMYSLRMTTDCNYTIYESFFYETTDGMLNEFQTKMQSKHFKRALFVAQGNVEQYRDLVHLFSPTVFIPYSKYEMMIYSGGLAKMEANDNGKFEVLDCAPVVEVHYYGFDNKKTITRILGPSIFVNDKKPVGQIRGFGVAYGPEISYISRKVTKRTSKVLIQFQDCNSVRVKATLRLNGVLMLQAFASGDDIYNSDEDKKETPAPNFTEDSNINLDPNNAGNSGLITEIFNKNVIKLLFEMKKEGKDEYISAAVCNDGGSFNYLTDENKEKWFPMFLTLCGEDIYFGSNALFARNLCPGSTVSS